MQLILDACCNHLGNKYILNEMIKEAGKLDAIIKFQLYDSCFLNKSYPNYTIRRKEYEDFEIKNSDLDFIFEKCIANGVKPCFTIFNETRCKDLLRFEYTDFLLKIASPDAMKFKFIENVKKLFPEKKMIISCGMIGDELVRELRLLFPEASLMYCISQYPTSLNDVNYDKMKEFDGFSDHTIGLEALKNMYDLKVNVAYYERHFTLSRNLPGRDQVISIDPDEALRIANILGMKGTIKTFMERFSNGNY